jgi:hypothetical protein
MTGADPKYRDAVITRMSEILDMSKQHGLRVDPTGTYTFDNPLDGKVGVNDKYKSTGKFNKKGFLGLGGVKDDDNNINNLAYFALDKIIRGSSELTAQDTPDFTNYLAEVDNRI